MNAIYLSERIKRGDTVRITTDTAVGVIGRVTDISPANNGIEIQGFKENELLEQIDNAVEFDKALFPISDIKYIFRVTLNEIKSTETNGADDS